MWCLYERTSIWHPFRDGEFNQPCVSDEQIKTIWDYQMKKNNGSLLHMVCWSWRYKGTF
jgi:hypothetical protein